MTNTEYIQKMVAANDYIYADTSALMDADWLRPFSEKAEPLFKAAGKYITISPAVRSELIRHIGSSDLEKSSRALAAANILAEHKDLFRVMGGQLDDEEIEKAFADMELLVMLMLNRRGNRQLLIANDRKLSKDAYVLNDQQSCQGGRINVCYINRFGDLQMCDCVTVSRPEESLSAERTEKPESAYDKEKLPKTVVEEDLSKMDRMGRLDKVHNESAAGNNDALKWILAFGSGAASGYAIGKYGKAFKGLLKTALSML